MYRFGRLLTLVALSAPALAQGVFSEDYESGTNAGSWAWGTGNEIISPLNGNPGAFLKDLTLVTCCPTLSTAPGVSSIFTGDYRARNVTSVGVDLVTLHTDIGVSNRPLSVILRSDNGTTRPSDDIAAYFIGSKDIPDPGVTTITPAGWADFEFAIDSQANMAPSGWVLYRENGTNPKPQDWGNLMQDVDQLQFFYGDPTQFFLIISWDVGMDNPRIAETGVVSRNGSGINRVSLTNRTQPLLGTRWETEVDVSAHPGAVFSAVLGYAAPTSGIVLAAGELLVNIGTAQLAQSIVLSSGGTDIHGFDLPPDLSFAGEQVFCQAAIFGGALELSNALDMVIGI